MAQDIFNIDKNLLENAQNAENDCREIFKNIDKISEYNENKVLKAFIDNKVSSIHFNGTTGYGYNDLGRETLDKVFSQIFGTEDALVRHNFVNGTHALTVALFGVLRQNDLLVSITGKPYDTLDEVIGIKGKGSGSLKDYGIKYSQLDLLDNGKVDIQNIHIAVKDTKAVFIQRSRGYSSREPLSISEISDIVKIVRYNNKNAIIIIDNCYGEFVDFKEPSEVGCDLVVGSLIKNPGGGIAETGGYIAGKEDLVKLCSYRLTSVGIGKEVGCTLNQLRAMYMGLYFAPSVVASSLKISCFATCLLEKLGFECYPKFNEKRNDIISFVKFYDREKLIAFCQGIQKGSAVDSFVLPEPWNMPGYDSEVIMASGSFTMGSSIELSADAPIKSPYAVWLQGGLTYNMGKMGIITAINNIL